MTRKNRTVGKWTKAQVQYNLQCNDEWQYRALEFLYDRQTAHEQGMCQTIDKNGVGFTGFDAEILSSFASQVKRGRRLSGRQFEICNKRLPKYWNQVMDGIEERMVAEALIAA